jgi:hypothetical protein
MNEAVPMDNNQKIPDNAGLILHFVKNSRYSESIETC